jgi:hypothetical protein
LPLRGDGVLLQTRVQRAAAPQQALHLAQRAVDTVRTAGNQWGLNPSSYPFWGANAASVQDRGVRCHTVAYAPCGGFADSHVRSGQ